MKKYLFVFVSTVLSLAGSSLAVYAQCGPDGTQPCSSPSARAKANVNSGAKKGSTKPKTNPASSQQSKTKLSKTKNDNENIFRSLQLEPQAVKNTGAANDLFPLSGVTIGKTTEVQLQNMGAKRSTYTADTTQETSIYYNVLGQQFLLQNGVAHSISVMKFNPIPAKWGALGFNWTLSFNEFAALVKKLGYKIDYSVPPPQNLESDKKFTGKIIASKSDGTPTKLLANFFFSDNKTSVNSKETFLYMNVTIPE